MSSSQPDHCADSDRISRAQKQFHPQVSYLNTPTAGLPPDCALSALRAVQQNWQAGTMNPADFDRDVARSRAAFAQLCAVPVEQVALGSQVSVFAGLVAASLPPGSEVLTAIGDFTSILFPFMVQRDREVSIREVPLEDLAGAVRPQTTLVSVSAVQSATGAVADLDALAAVCAETGTRTFVDTSQAAGWFPVRAGMFSYTACGAYKWLLSPRGTAFFTIQPDLIDSLVPHTAGWYASQNPWEGIYGSPLRLASDARRFDVSPAWFALAGAAPALELLAGVGVRALQAHSVGLANQFRAEMGLSPSDSAIVSLGVEDGEQTAQALREASVMASVRAGRLRLGFHLANTEDDVQRCAKVLTAVS